MDKVSILGHVVGGHETPAARSGPPFTVILIAIAFTILLQLCAWTGVAFLVADVLRAKPHWYEGLSSIGNLLHWGLLISACVLSYRGLTANLVYPQFRESLLDFESKGESPLRRSYLCLVAYAVQTAYCWRWIADDRLMQYRLFFACELVLMVGGILLGIYLAWNLFHRAFDRTP